MENLRPCPFCKKPTEVVHIAKDKWHTYTKCEECFITIGIFDAVVNNDSP